MKAIEIFKIPIHCLTRNEAVSALDRVHRIYTPNPEILLEARKNPEFSKALLQGDLMLADGNGLLLVTSLARFKWPWLRLLLFFPLAFVFIFWKAPFQKIIPEVIHGSDFMNELLIWADKNKKSLAFIGAKGDRAQKTAEYFKKKLPSLHVIGAESFDLDEKLDEWLKVNHPDVLLLAYGAPKEQVWIYKNEEKLKKIQIIMGLGGSFDFYSGSIPRAPKWMRKVGLEWLWRLFQEPKKRLKRIFNATLRFPWIVLSSSSSVHVRSERKA